MYRRDLLPSRAAERQCYSEIAKLGDTLFGPLQRGGLSFAQNPLLDLPLVEYIFRVVLPTVRSSRVHLWLRVYAASNIPPAVRARHGAVYVQRLERELGALREMDAFGARWLETYTLLTQQELELMRRAYGA